MIRIVEFFRNQHFVRDREESMARSAAYLRYVSTYAVCNTADKNSTLKLGKRRRFERSLVYLQRQPMVDWVLWSALCISFLCHGAIFHIMGSKYSCPWIGDNSSRQAIQRLMNPDDSVKPNSMPAYLINSAISTHPTVNLTVSDQIQKTASETYSDTGHQSYNLSTETTGWKISAPVIQYPKNAFLKHEQGTVILQGSLNQKKSFDNIHIVNSSGINELDQAAIQWFQKVKLLSTHLSLPKPGSLFTQTIQFQLENEPVPSS